MPNCCCKMKKILFLVLISVAVSSGLYEDQIGKFDWHQKYFGPIRFILNDLNQPKRIIIGAENNIIGAVNSNNGAILYRNILENGKLLYLGHFDKSILSISRDKQIKIRAFSPTNGVEKNQWILHDNAFDLATEFQSTVYLVKTSPDQIIITPTKLTEEELLDGDKITVKVDTDLCKIGGGYLFCLKKNDLTVIRLKDGYKVKKVMEFDVLEFEPSSSEDLTLVLIRGPGYHMFRIEDVEASIRITEVKLESQAASITLSFAPGKLFISRLENPHLITTDIFSKDLVKTDSFQTKSTFLLSSLQATKVFTVSQNYGLVGFTKDELFFGSKLESKNIDWSRQESLASILALEMVDYPSQVKVWNPYTTQMSIITAFITRIKYEFESLFTYEKIDDQFGLRKMVVFVTSVGKVLGMDSMSGLVHYTFLLPNFSTFEGKAFLYVQRAAKYDPLKPLATVLYKNSLNNSTILFPFNPIEGLHLDEPQLFPKILTSTIALHGSKESQFMKPVILLDVNFNVHTYPHGIPIDKMYFFLAQEFLLRGFDVRSGAVMKAKASNLWNLNVGPNSKLLGIYGKLSCEKIHSQGRVLPDRSVSYKYMNPNLVVVVTSEEDNINLFLVDAVSGAIIHSIWHKKSRGPVHVAHSEHWIIYSLFNEKYRRYEINSIELYEGSTQSNSTAFSSFTTKNQPIIVKQSYIFPTGIQSIGYTRTEKGITNKDILIGLPTGGVLQLPRVVLQPRLNQQHYLTQIQDEDGNFHHMPYIPELPIPSDMIINYNQSVRRIEGIRTWPTKLESTCLVLVHGSDLFYTKVAPSKTFDVLKDDFDHWFITVVLGALCAGAYLTKRLSARKQLEQAWR